MKGRDKRIFKPDAMIEFEPRREKTNVLGFEQVRHIPGCAATEDD